MSRKAEKPMVRFLARSQPVRRMLRRLVWSRGAMEILEEVQDSAAVHQMRWAGALEHGSTVPLFLPSLPDGAPQDFAAHWEECRCVFWHWFLARGVETEIRTVLEVGCGTGHLAHHFVRGGFDVTGVTCNPHERNECLRRGVKVLENDFHFLSVPDGAFDLVFSSHSLEHSISPLFALWEWTRVVRPGGYLMIVVPMPLDQDARAAYPAYYDPLADDLAFPQSSGDRAVMVAHAGYTVSTCGGPFHPFVLSYWQLRWLFHLAGLELMADGAEDPLARESKGTEYLDGRAPYDSQSPLSGMFLLRKPERTIP